MLSVSPFLYLNDVYEPSASILEFALGADILELTVFIVSLYMQCQIYVLCFQQLNYVLLHCVPCWTRHQNPCILPCLLHESCFPQFSFRLFFAVTLVCVVFCCYLYVWFFLAGPAFGIFFFSLVTSVCSLIKPWFYEILKPMHKLNSYEVFVMETWLSVTGTRGFPLS